jgi:hypothetical protein
MILVDVFLLKKYFAGSAIEKLPQTVILVCGNPWSSLSFF